MRVVSVLRPSKSQSGIMTSLDGLLDRSGPINARIPGERVSMKCLHHFLVKSLVYVAGHDAILTLRQGNFGFCSSPLSLQVDRLSVEIHAGLGIERPHGDDPVCPYETALSGVDDFPSALFSMEYGPVS